MGEREVDFFSIALFDQFLNLLSVNWVDKPKQEIDGDSVNLFLLIRYVTASLASSILIGMTDISSEIYSFCHPLITPLDEGFRFTAVA